MLWKIRLFDLGRLPAQKPIYLRFLHSDCKITLTEVKDESYQRVYMRRSQNVSSLVISKFRPLQCPEEVLIKEYICMLQIEKV